MTFTVTTKVQLTDERIADVLVSAFEGGINYWAEIVSVNKPADAIPHATERGWLMVGDEGYPSYIASPIIGGSVMLRDADDGANDHLLNRVMLENGLNIMAAEYPNHFADILNENDDAGTADVLVQLALFGEVVYG